MPKLAWVTWPRTARSATDRATPATSPPSQRQWIAQANSAPITQNPGTVACMPSPLTIGETRISATATARSASSRPACGAAVGVRPDRDRGPQGHDDDAGDTSDRAGEVVGAVEVERQRVDQHDDPQHGQCPEQPVLDGPRRRSRPGPGGRQDAFFWSAAAFAAAAASAASFSRRLDSALARVEYMSTYSWPESRMISYMISSVIDRRM